MQSKARKGKLQRIQESGNQANWLDAFLARHQSCVIVALCLVAAIRILVFSAAFPPFNNIDEAQHYDLVVSYAHGIVPDHLSDYLDSSARVLSVYYTPEYNFGPEKFRTGEIPPPLWTAPPDVRHRYEAELRTVWKHRVNTEATQPPVYYAIAAVWYKIGELFGIRSVYLMYWVRFMNVWIMGLLIWSSHVFIRRLFPQNLSLRLGVPLLLAFLPQDVFYSITNDAMSALPFCFCFFRLVELRNHGPRSYVWCAITGLSAAACFLVKYSNAAILMLLGLAVILTALRLRGEEKMREGLPRLFVILVCCLAPVVAWSLWQYVAMHDITGSLAKTRALDWTPKPLGRMWDHPILSYGGFSYFARELTLNFWRGETLWHGSPLGSPWADVLYHLTTLIFLPAALIGGRLRRPKDGGQERYAELSGFFVLAVSVALLAWISMAFDFGVCPNPSREHPYVTSGRLIIGCIVPFMLLYVKGLDFLMRLVRINWSRIAFLCVIAAAVTVSEICISIGVFESAYNWFRLISS